MSEVAFYQLQLQPLEVALPKLLARVMQAGLRAVIRLASEERLASLDQALWNEDPDGFLAHGSKDTPQPENQPIYLTLGEDNPNDAGVLVLVEGKMAVDLGGYDRCLYMFDGRSEELKAQARQHWQEFKDAGHGVTYWQQTDAGGWEKKA
jgi:DNA polymerase-3 subunit chi